MTYIDPLASLPTPIRDAFAALSGLIYGHAVDHGHDYAAESDGPNSPDYEHTAETACEQETVRMYTILRDYLTEEISDFTTEGQ